MIICSRTNAPKYTVRLHRFHNVIQFLAHIQSKWSKLFALYFFQVGVCVQYVFSSTRSPCLNEFPVSDVCPTPVPWPS